MKPLIPTICLTGLAVVLAACVPPNARRDGMKPISRLDCPPNQGALQRTSASPDGRTCDYATADGASQVQLRLVSFTGSAENVLTPVETDLQALLPEKPEVDDNATTNADGDADDDGDTDADSNDKDDGDADTAADAATDADAKVVPPSENVNIDLPGLKISTQGQNANIHVGGVNIEANDDKSSVHVTHGTPAHGQFSVDADDQGAVIRSKGGGADIRSTLIMASDKAGPHGWRVVGYEARGPRAGPLVIAVVKSKSEDHDEVFGQTKRLVRRAAGG